MPIVEIYKHLEVPLLILAAVLYLYLQPRGIRFGLPGSTDQWCRLDAALEQVSSA